MVERQLDKTLKKNKKRLEDLKKQIVKCMSKEDDASSGKKKAQQAKKAALINKIAKITKFF